MKLLLCLLFLSLLAITAVQSGSWCNEPQNEPYWGAATASCCNGWMGRDRRCHDIPNCAAFYACCRAKFDSANELTDICY